MTSRLKILLPRVVRQEQTKDLLKLKKNSSQQVKEIGDTLDNLCRLITFHEKLRHAVYQIDERVYASANRLKTCDNDLKEATTKLHDAFCYV